MRKITFTLLLFVGFTSIFAQKNQSWFDIGVKGGYMPTYMINMNSIDDEHYKYKYSAGYLFGVKAGYNFNDSKAITVEGLYSQSVYSQDIHLKDSISTLDFNSTVINKNIDIPLMYRSSGGDGSYFEIGPQVSILQSARQTVLTYNSDVSENLSKINYGAVLGFGQYIGLNDKLGLMFGFRFGYTFNDVVGSNRKDVNGSPFYTPYDLKDKFSYKQSHPFFAAVLLEFNFDLGYVVSAKCGKKTKFVLF